MSLFQSVFQAVRSWRRRRGGPKKTPKRAGVALERLDHRRLMSVNFTGNVEIDFPATTQPGVVVLSNPNVVKPQIPPDLQPLIGVSGLEVDGIRLAYDPTTDELSIGLDGPDNLKTGQDVIAGDIDNNLDETTVSPAVEALRPGEFIDFADLGGSETMGAFLDLDNDNIPDIVAGMSNDNITEPKLYQVAEAVVNPMMPGIIPAFGNPLPNNTGNVYLINSRFHPNLEFSITHFSELYQAETGKTLSPDTTFQVGGFGNSNDDDGISEAFFPATPLTFSDVIPPPPPDCPVCPPPPPITPLEPRILINPHEHRHINTAHPTDVRVNIFGSAGFDVSQIDPTTVRLGGAPSIFNFTRALNRDKYPDATFVFRGSDINLPSGVTDAVVTGNLKDGTPFASTFEVFNRDYSFTTPPQQERQAVRKDVFGAYAEPTPMQRNFLRAADMIDRALSHGGLWLDGTPDPAAQAQQQGGPTVSIPLRTSAQSARPATQARAARNATVLSQGAPDTPQGPAISIPRRNSDPIRPGRVTQVVAHESRDTQTPSLAR